MMFIFGLIEQINTKSKTILYNGFFHDDFIERKTIYISNLINFLYQSLRTQKVVNNYFDVSKIIMRTH